MHSIGKLKVYKVYKVCKTHFSVFYELYELFAFDLPLLCGGGRRAFLEH